MGGGFLFLVYNKYINVNLESGMDNDKNFNDEDKQKVIKFMNIVATNAKFEMNTAEIIEYFKLLSFMQQTLIPKIDKHCLEVLQVVDPEPAAESSDSSTDSVGE